MKEKNEQTTVLENLLQVSLTPVMPRPEFVQRLGNRLHESPLIVSKPPQYIRLGYQVLAMVSVLGGLVLLLTNVKAIATFISNLGIFQPLRRQQQRSFGSPAG